MMNRFDVISDEKWELEDEQTDSEDDQLDETQVTL